MNVPDDWGSYYYKCEYCGGRYHASEGGCNCLDDHEQCAACKADPSMGVYTLRRHSEGWYPIDLLTEVDGKYFCHEHVKCYCCEEECSPERPLKWSDEVDGLLCERCEPEDHWCPAQGELLDHMNKVVNRPE